MSIDRGVNKEDVVYMCMHVRVYIYSGIYLAMTKNGMMPFSATWVDLEMIMLNEVSQKKTVSPDITYM